jgi:hypothetical protein
MFYFFRSGCASTIKPAASLISPSDLINSLIFINLAGKCTQPPTNKASSPVQSIIFIKFGQSTIEKKNFNQNLCPMLIYHLPQYRKYEFYPLWHSLPKSEK